MGELHLSPQSIAALADALAPRLAAVLQTAPQPSGLVDAHVMGDLLGMTAEWVRAHAAELGGVRLGEGARPRWRFDPEQAAARFHRRQVVPPVSRVPPEAQRRRTRSTASPLLPVMGQE
jgi:hypothetical protein